MFVPEYFFFLAKQRVFSSINCRLLAHDTTFMKFSKGTLLAWHTKRQHCFTLLYIQDIHIINYYSQIPTNAHFTLNFNDCLYLLPCSEKVYISAVNGPFNSDSSWYIISDFDCFGFVIFLSLRPWFCFNFACCHSLCTGIRC